MIGETVANYVIEARIGRTGVGELWQGRKADGATATIEILPVGPVSFAASDVTHPNLARTLETGLDAQGRPYLVYEPIKGESIHELVRRSGRLGSKQSADISGKIASALHALHRANFVHRGLAAESIYVDGETVTVLDAALVTAPTPLTAAYTAPEIWDNGKVDGRADVYALGCLTCELATGRLPFVGATLAELPDKHRTAVPPQLASLVAEVPKTLDMLVARMLAKNPEDRPRQASELSFVFELVEDNEAIAAFGSTVKRPTKPPA